MKITLHTSISKLSGLSDDATKALADAGFSYLSDLHEQDFTCIAQLATLQKDRRVIFEATISAGISVLFRKDALISDVPTISIRALKTLAKQNLNRLSDFEGRYYPSIYALIGYGPGKNLLIGLVLAGVNVNFNKPDWSESEWKTFVEKAVGLGLLTWEDVAVSACGELNPPQVGTGVADAVKHNYPKGKAMQHVWRWFYSLDGKCMVSGKRLFLEADHIIPREHFIKKGSNKKEADSLDNFQLLTKRENVIKRASHKLGGLSFAPAGAVLVYILLRFRPKTYSEFVEMCREHGLTMSNIRFQEGWAFAVWLSKAGEYKIEGDPTPFIRDV
ncbi:hypothetical protein M2318_005474 [Metapseudomonas resinovorans]|uniref:HNH endonuclease signature motif containing protein n=1 Tax=Metapseudomonas resinovorans TaxID=53412 RepID=UPI003D1AA8FF